MTASQPNVLFICTDQQRADNNGFMGHEVLQTPNIDSIAARGTVFESTWVSNPVCMPNRSTMITGRLPTAHGVVFNDRSLDWNANTYVRVLRAAGYRTALIGKSHLQHGLSRNAVAKTKLPPVQSEVFAAGWDAIEDAERYVNGGSPDPDDFYGFDHIELAIDHGARVSGHHLRWALEKGGNLEDLYGLQNSDAPARRRSEHWWQVYEPPYDPELHSTSFVTDRTIAFMQEASGQGRPWMAMCSFPDPHHPMTPPGEWFDRHDPVDMVLSSTIDDPLTDAPEHLQHFRQVHPTDQREYVTPCGALDHDIVREAQAATYGLVEMIDDGVGQVLAALDRLGQADNTIIVFTSDHGDMMGDHGLFLKGFMHYRGTLQVPLVISAPGMEPGRTSSLASTLDLAPTLLDLCDLEPYHGIQGTSLRPLLDDPSQSVRDHVLIEDDLPAAEFISRVRIPAKTRTLVTDSFRYTRNSKGEHQLFDLVEDFDEMVDLADRDPARKAVATEQMMDALIEADDLAKGTPSLVN